MYKKCGKWPREEVDYKPVTAFNAMVVLQEDDDEEEDCAVDCITNVHFNYSLRVTISLPLSGLQ